MFSSCEMDKTAIMEDDLIFAEEDALSEVVFDDAMESVDDAVILTEGQFTGGLKSMPQMADCREITVDKPDSARWPKEITIDWGEEGCTGPNGQTRSGKIKITIDGWMFVPGSSRSVEFIDYYINDIKVEGTRTTTNEGRNDDGNLVFRSELENGKLIIPRIDSSSTNSAVNYIEISKEFTRFREWVEGELTRNPWDNVFYITGHAEGTNFRQEAYTRTITYRLEKNMSCRFIVSGTVEISVEERPVITLDYGNGECDNKATVTIDGETKEILLRHWHRFQFKNRP